MFNPNESENTQSHVDEHNSDAHQDGLTVVLRLIEEQHSNAVRDRWDREAELRRENFHALHDSEQHHTS